MNKSPGFDICGLLKRHLASQYIAIKIKFRFEFPVSSVKMGRVMLPVLLELHGNQNTIK